ncbi:hypothetical protein GGR53DRAFT_513984 [Hypoxylon sp. FL1150]|nr:hypothetical protein GGR53DRAFT_513984 [Hypoxylon sp. FL1150]
MASPGYTDARLLTAFPSICILSLLRVVYVDRWDLSDATYSVPSSTILTVLEPTLGIVNASLPVIKPALDRIFHLRVFEWTKEALTGCSWSNSNATSSRDRLPSSAIENMSNGRSMQPSDGIIPPINHSRNSIPGI